MNILTNICPEKELQLEKERNEVMANAEFQAWMKELNVSQSCEDRAAKIRALDLQMQYDTKKYSNLNFTPRYSYETN